MCSSPQLFACGSEVAGQLCVVGFVVADEECGIAAGEDEGSYIHPCGELEGAIKEEN